MLPLCLLINQHRISRRCHVVALLAHMGGPFRTIALRQSLIRDVPRLPPLESPPPKHHTARDSSDQAQPHDDGSNNNAGFVRKVEALDAKRIGVLEFKSAADNLTLWRRVLWVVAVLFETVRANIRSRGHGVGLKPCTVDGCASKTSSVFRISTQLTIQETIDCGRSCLAEELLSMPCRICKLEGSRAEE